MIESAFFRFDDPHASEIMGLPINPHWWSRHYEYPWALEYAEAGLVVADMGCGWMYRPFKDALAALGCQVYAVDGDSRLLSQEKRPGVEFVVADITQPIEAIADKSLDRVFCISVLEDVGELVPKALQEFHRCLKDDGLCILTFDVQYEVTKPLGQYPGVVYFKFEDALAEAGFEFKGFIDINKIGALYHEEFNLCCFHCVLKKR